MKITLHGRAPFDEWRDAARRLLGHNIAPQEVAWRTDDDRDLFDAPDEPLPPALPDRRVTATQPFLDLAQALICHSDPARFALAYRLLWRLQSQRDLLDRVTDADVARARLMQRSVHRDQHKMTAFVRFKEVPAQEDKTQEDRARTNRRAFVAWFEPDHHIVARTAPFFMRRFTDMDWIIATPRGSAAWDGEALTCDDAPAVKPDLDDATDELWRTYFASIFNPARLKIKMMQSEMPKKYWRNLPEAPLIPALISGAEQRVRDMADRLATDTVPRFHDRLRGRR